MFSINIKIFSQGFYIGGGAGTGFNPFIQTIPGYPFTGSHLTAISLGEGNYLIADAGYSLNKNWNVELGISNLHTIAPYIFKGYDAEDRIDISANIVRIMPIKTIDARAA